MEFKYCPQCGELLTQKEIGDEGLIPFCSQCDKAYFNSPKISILSVVINQEDEIVLLKQSYVSTTSWVLVAGYIKEGETAEETVAREILEETGQVAESCKYISSYYYEKKNLLILGYAAYVKKRDFAMSKEVDDLQWVKISDAEGLIREGSIAQKLLLEVRSMLQNNTTELT